MNWDQLEKQVHTDVRLRPLPVRIGNDGRVLARRDDIWRVEAVQKRRFVEIRNLSTGHSKKLNSDNIREFRTPNFLMLRCLLIIMGPRVDLEPLIIREQQHPAQR